MIIKLRNDRTAEELQELRTWLAGLGVDVVDVQGSNHLVLCLVGDTSAIDPDNIKARPIVEDVKRIEEPYKAAGRSAHPEDTVVDVGGVLLGGDNFAIIAGPCSVESEPQMVAVAEAVKSAGAVILRGGAFKPRTSPYTFQGLGIKGIDILLKARRAAGLPVVTEIMEINELDLFENVDMIQVGARNMQNFQLLKELSHVNKPVLLKRGLGNTLDELLMSAEYLMSGGNEQVVLCERGIRTFEHAARNTLDISAVPILKKRSHLPVVVDPSHAAGSAELVKPLALAAAAAGADGIMIEVHNDPKNAMCDGAQSLTPEEFKDVASSVFAIRPYAYRYGFSK